MHCHTDRFAMRLANIMQSILISAPKLTSCSACACRAYGSGASVLAGRPLGFAPQRGLPSTGLGCTTSNTGHRSLGANFVWCSSGLAAASARLWQSLVYCHSVIAVTRLLCL